MGKFMFGILSRFLMIILFPFVLVFTLIEIIYIIFFRWLFLGVPVYERYDTLIERHYF